MEGMVQLVVVAEGVARDGEVVPKWPLGPHAGTAGTAVIGVGPVDPKVVAEGAWVSVLRESFLTKELAAKVVGLPALTSQQDPTPTLAARLAQVKATPSMP